MLAGVAVLLIRLGWQADWIGVAAAAAQIKGGKPLEMKKKTGSSNAAAHLLR